MAHLLLLTLDPANAAALVTKAALEGAGHTVTAVADSSLGTLDFTPYAAVVTVRLSAGVSPVRLREQLQAGKPLILDLVDRLFEATPLPTRLRLCAGVQVVFDGPTQPSPSTANVITVNHPITAYLGTPGPVAFFTNNYAAGLTDATPLGVRLADAPVGGQLGGMPLLTALAAGTPDRDGVPVGAKVVLVGQLGYNGSDYTAAGKTLLASAVAWALPTPPVIAVSVAAPEPATSALLAPDGAVRVVLSAPAAAEVRLAAPDGTVLAPGVALAGPAAAGALGAPAGGVRVALAGPAAAGALGAPAGGVRVRVPGAPATAAVLAGPGAVDANGRAGTAVARVDGVPAALRLAATAGLVSSTPRVNGPVAAAALLAGVGEVRALVLDRTAPMLLALIDAEVRTQPGVLRLRVTSGVPAGTVHLFLDGVGAPLASPVLDGEGGALVTLAISGRALGGHTVSVGIFTTAPVATPGNSKSFTVTGSPSPAPPPTTVVVIPARPVEVARWVLQSRDGLLSYVLPRNPNSSSPVYGELAFSSESTTVNDGLLVEWEGAAAPTLWSIAGRVFTRAEHDDLLAWQGRGRFYVTDHLGRRALVKLATLATTRVRDRERPWHHTYQLDAWILSADGLVLL